MNYKIWNTINKSWQDLEANHPSMIELVLKQGNIIRLDNGDNFDFSPPTVDEVCENFLMTMGGK